MEVHHHPEVEKKGFKEYLLEGVMIFIAVMMGFFAESLREHISERNRANEFAAGLMNDLKADTASLKVYISYFRNARNNVDTLIQLLSDNEPSSIPSGKLYWYGLWGGAIKSFVPHKATLLEMQSSGSFRYFATPAFKRQLGYYDQLCNEFQAFNTQSFGVYTEVRKIRAQLFSFKYNGLVNDISKIKDSKIRQMKIDSFIKTNPPLLNTDKILFNQYVELVRSRFFSYDVSMGDSLLTHSTKLIGELKKQYKLDEE